MIIGGCPYDDCGGLLFLPLCDAPPLIEKHICEHCERTVWTLHSRIDPQSWTNECFLGRFRVDAKTKTITERDKPIGGQTKKRYMP